MTYEDCSNIEDCKTKITKFLEKNSKCVHKAHIEKELNTYKETPDISLANYKRLLCFSQSSCDRNWTRNCGEISQFKKSKKRSKSLRKPSRKSLRKTSRKSLRKTSRKSPSKSLRNKL